MSAGCPTRWKVAYASRSVAKAEANRVRRSGLKHGQLRPYRCTCGTWHLTAMPKADMRRMRRERRRAA